MASLPIKIAKSVEEAPSYKGGDFKGGDLKSAVIVMNGTIEGKPTVDLVFGIRGPDGEEVDICVAMTTGGIIKGLAAAIYGAEKR